MNKKIKNLDLENIVFLIAIIFPFLFPLFYWLVEAISVGQNTSLITFSLNYFNDFILFFNNSIIFKNFNDWFYSWFSTSSNFIVSWCLCYIEFLVLIYLFRIVIDTILFLPKLLLKWGSKL